jgi:Zn-dependent alcohol dehydrogenase
VWTGQYSDRGTISIRPQDITFNALQIIGSAQFNIQDRTDYLAFLERVPHKWETMSRVITDKFTVDEADEAFAKAKKGESIKSVFVKAR